MSYYIMYDDAPAQLVHLAESTLTHNHLVQILNGEPEYFSIKYLRNRLQREHSIQLHPLHPAYSEENDWIVVKKNANWDCEDINEQAYGKLGIMEYGTVIVASKQLLQIS